MRSPASQRVAEVAVALCVAILAPPAAEGNEHPASRPAHRTKTETLPTSAAVPAGLSAGDWSGIREAYEVGRHAIDADEEALEHVARDPDLLRFQVSLDCVNDEAATTDTEAHDDFMFQTSVHRDAIDGEIDTHPGCDVCPRPPHPADEEKKFEDKGCGTKDKAIGKLRAAVRVDLIVK